MLTMAPNIPQCTLKMLVIQPGPPFWCETLQIVDPKMCCLPQDTEMQQPSFNDDCCSTCVAALAYMHMVCPLCLWTVDADLSHNIGAIHIPLWILPLCLLPLTKTIHYCKRAFWYYDSWWDISGMRSKTGGIHPTSCRPNPGPTTPCNFFDTDIIQYQNEKCQTK